MWNARVKLCRADVQEARLCSHGAHRICAAAGLGEYRQFAAGAGLAAPTGDECEAGPWRWAWTRGAAVAHGEHSAGGAWRGRRTVSRLPRSQCDSEADGESVGPKPAECFHGLGCIRVRLGHYVADRTGIWNCSRLAGGTGRSEQQLERDLTDHDATAQGARRQVHRHISDCTLNLAGCGRGAVPEVSLCA